MRDPMIVRRLLVLLCAFLFLGTSLVTISNELPAVELEEEEFTRGQYGVSISGWVKDGGGAVPAIIVVGAFNASDLMFINMTDYSITGNYQMFVPENMSLLLLAFSINGQKCGGYDLHGYFPESANLVVNSTDVQQNFTVTECYEVILECYDPNGELISEQNFTQTRWTTNSSGTIATDSSQYSIFSGVGNGMGFNAPVVMIPPNERTDIWFQWEHPGFGRVNLEMDNDSAGYGGPAQGAEVVQVNYDLARSLNKRMNDKEADYSGRGYNLSQRTKTFQTFSDSYLGSATVAVGMTRVDYADQCINASLWALEGTEMDRAVEDIETSRKGNLTVQVVDKTGYPVPNANVSITQTSHDFLFGVFDHIGQVGEGVYQQLRDIGVNYATAGFYWHVTEPTPGNFTWDIINNTIGVPKLVDMGFKVKAHALIYLIDLALPPYMNAGMSFTELNQTVYDHVYTLVYGYRDLIDVWNVVNEAHGTGANYGLTREEMLQIIKTGVKAINDADPGSEIVVNNAFYWFAEQMAGGYLLYDDNYTMSIQEYNDWLIAEGVDFDIVGQQMYEGGYASFFEEVGIGPGMPASTFEFSVLSEILDALEQWDKPVHITEQSVSGSWNYTADWPGAGYWHKKWDYQTQADFLTYFYTLVFSKPKAEAITWWDLDDNISFMKDGALFDASLNPKPIFYALADFIANHTTDTFGITGTDGNVTLRGYGGDYNISVEKDGVRKDVVFHITEQQDNFILVKLDDLELFPDFAVSNSDIQFNVTMPTTGLVQMDVTVHNLGEKVGKDVDVMVLYDYIDNDTNGYQMKTIPMLDGGATDTVQFDWDFSEATWGVNLTVRVDPGNETWELVETNNNLSLSYPFARGSVSGEVVVNGTTMAIENALVSFVGPMNLVTTTDSAGGFGFDILLAGNYNVTVIKPDYHHYNNTITIEDGVKKNLEIELDLITTGVITGIVKKWGYDKPLMDVKIELWDTDYNTTTNETGWYILENIPAGNYTLSAWKEDHSFEEINIIVLKNRTVYVNLSLVEWEVDPSMGIYVYVFDEDGNPIENATVSLRNESTGAQTDEDGLCRMFHNIVVWPWDNVFTIRISAEGYYTHIEDVKIYFNEHIIETLNFTLKKINYGSIKGSVVSNSTGNILRYTTVFLEELNVSVLTHPNGTFEFTKLVPGNYTLKISHDGYIGQTLDVRVDPGATVEIDVRLVPIEPVLRTGSVRGYVLDADTDEPIGGATLEIQGGVITTTSNEFGWYSVSEVPVGMQNIRVSADGYETQTFQVSVANGSKVEFDIYLDKEGGGQDDGESSNLGLIIAFVMIGILIVIAAVVLIVLLLVKRIKEPPPPEEEDIEEIEDEDESEVDLEE